VSRAVTSRRAVASLAAVLVMVAAGLAVALVAMPGDRGDGPSTGTRASAGDSSDSPSTGTGTGAVAGEPADSDSTTTSTAVSTTVRPDPAAAMVSSISASVLEQAGDVITPAEANCMARELVAQVGLARLQQVGDAVAAQPSVNPLSLLTEEEKATAAARMQGCVDPAKLAQLAPSGE
jgi:hypothetical protein